MLVDAKRIAELVGSMMILPTVLFPIPVLDRIHVFPAFVDFMTPYPGESPASISPVPKYIILVLFESIATLETPTEFMPVLVPNIIDQLWPALVDFHKPPCGEHPK